jgi:hypothetical protein
LARRGRVGLGRRGAERLSRHNSAWFGVQGLAGRSRSGRVRFGCGGQVCRGAIGRGSAGRGGAPRPGSVRSVGVGLVAAGEAGLERPVGLGLGTAGTVLHGPAIRPLARRGSVWQAGWGAQLMAVHGFVGHGWAGAAVNGEAFPGQVLPRLGKVRQAGCGGSGMEALVTARWA